MKIGTQSKGFTDTSETFQNTMQILKKSGVDYLDLNLNGYLNNREIYSGSLKGYKSGKKKNDVSKKAQLVHFLWGIKGRMMKAGLWPEKLTVPEAARQAAQKAERNGFFDQNENGLIRFFQPLKKAADEAGIQFCQAHAPYPIMVPWNREVTTYMKKEVIPKCIAVCQELNIPYLVVHPWYDPNDFGKYEDAVSFFVSLGKLCKEKGVMLCLENIYDTMENHLVPGPCSDIGTAVELIDRLNKEAGIEFCGFCLDTGHLKLTGGDLCHAVQKLGDRLKCLHINDNDGRADLHILPEKTDFEFRDFARELKSSGYQGILNFEVFGSVRLHENQSEAAELIAQAGRQINAWMEE